MSRLLASLPLTVTLTSLSLAGASAGPVVPNEFVSGSGRVGDFRFTVTGHDAGQEGALGQMALRFDDGTEVRAAVECAGIVSNVASTLGPIEESSRPGFVEGNLLEFEMMDRGSPGSGDPDLFGFNLPAFPASCTFEGAGVTPIDAGNIHLIQEGAPGGGGP